MSILSLILKFIVIILLLTGMGIIITYMIAKERIGTYLIAKPIKPYGQP